MKNLLLTIAIAALMVACKKEDEVKPTPQPPVQEEYDCDSHRLWYMTVYLDCEKYGRSRYTITNEESKRIDSTFKMDECVLVEFTDINNNKQSGYWYTYPMQGRSSKPISCLRYGKD